jgi:hypothetical protein
MFEALRQGSDHLRLLPVLPAAFRHHLRACQGPEPRGEDIRRGDHEASLAARLPGHQAGSKRLVEEVDVELIHKEVMDYPFNLFEF